MTSSVVRLRLGRPSPLIRPPKTRAVAAYFCARSTALFFAPSEDSNSRITHRSGRLGLGLP